ncbi:MAG: ABC transporter substrate-binding protein [Dehalococcoidales bacterium]|nr:ABC transporter substrate-binding protein [Dehalococcoidales bacterium]
MNRGKLLTLLVGICLLVLVITVPFMSACNGSTDGGNGDNGGNGSNGGNGGNGGNGNGTTGVQTMRIGLLGSFTGSYAPYGGPLRDSSYLARDMLNEAGGFTVNGQQYKIEYIEYDDRTDPKRTVAGLNMMADQYGIQWVVGPQTSHCTFAAEAISEPRKIAMISGAAATDLTRPGIKYFWSATGNVGIRAAALWPYYINVMKIKTISVITENYAYALSMRNDGISEIKKLGGQVVGDELFESLTTDFSTIIARIRQPNPDVLYVCASPAECILVVKQVYEAGWKVQIVSLTELISDDLFRVAGKAANGVMGMSGLDYFAYKKGLVPQPVLDKMGFDIDGYFNLTDRWVAKYGETNMNFANLGARFLQAYVEGFKRSGTVTDMDQFMTVFRGMEYNPPDWKMKVLPNQLFTTWIPVSVFYESTKADKYDLLAVSGHTDDFMKNWEAVTIKEYKTITEIRKERGY